MVRWSVTFFVMAIISAIFGFLGWVDGGAEAISKVLFFIFLALFIVTVLFGWSIFKKVDGKEKG